MNTCIEICQNGGERCQGGPPGPDHGHVCTCTFEIPPVPEALCGEGGCVFLSAHDGEHSWGGAS